MTLGISLVAGTVVPLAMDGTLVYVEEVQPTFAAVVALPEQPDSRRESAVFQPGRVGVKKISPYSQPEEPVDPDTLSELNREFLGTFQHLRALHGPMFVLWSEAEKAKMSVRKAGPSTRVKLSTEEREARREERRAAKKRCATCGKKRAEHDDQTGHEFATRERKTREPRVSRKDLKYHVVTADLTKAQAHSDKFKPGNRFHRVFLALNALTDSTGTIGDVADAVDKDGGRPMKDTLKVVRRALKQLSEDACGPVVETL